jgi:hypothetical protein
LLFADVALHATAAVSKQNEWTVEVMGAADHRSFSAANHTPALNLWDFQKISSNDRSPSDDQHHIPDKPI